MLISLEVVNINFQIHREMCTDISMRVYTTAAATTTTNPTTSTAATTTTTR